MTANAKKKRKRRKDERPGEIVEAGLLEFSEKGFAGTRLEDVAARAGVVKGTIYRYFDNKEALFEAVIRSRALPALDAVEAQVNGFPGPTEELLKMIFTIIYDRLIGSDASGIIRVVIGEGARFPAITEFYHREIITKGERLLRLIVERGIERGEFRKSAATQLPIILMSPGIMAALWKLTFDRHHPVPLGDFLAAHIDLVLEGIKAR